jgi:hypothetical protein
LDPQETEVAMPERKINQKSDSPISQEDLTRLLEMIGSIRYGSITLLIQDSKVVQIDKSEKVRLV